MGLERRPMDLATSLKRHKSRPIFRYPKNDISTYGNVSKLPRGVFRTQSNIYDGAFVQK